MQHNDAPNFNHPCICILAADQFGFLFTLRNTNVFTWMYVSLRLRYNQIIHNITSHLVDMALDPRAYPGIAAEVRQLKSSASTPSLRSRESELVPMGRTTPDNGGGNVRVVVRVRGFLPRGMESTANAPTDLIAS